MELDPNDETDLLFTEAVIGVEMEKFITSPHGRFLYLRAKEEIKKFTEWAMSPDSKKEEFEGRRLPAVAALTVIRWVSEAIAGGRNAEKQLEQRQDGEER